MKTTRMREIYAQSRGWPIWLRLLFRRLLLWIELKTFDAFVEQEVTDAIEAWHREEQILHPEAQPIITEKPSEVPGLPELRIRAPWIDP